MTIHTRESTFQPVQDALHKPRHAVLDLDVRDLSRRFVVFTPSGATIEALVELGAREIGGVARPDLVSRIVSHNPDNLLAIARKSRFDAANPVAEGFFAFLMLNAEGLRRLADGTFDGVNPDLSLLAGQSERPAGIYSWAVCAPRGLAAALPLVMQKISTPLYRDVDVFANAMTEDGAHFVESLGLRAGAMVDGRHVPKLHWLKRSGADEVAAPLYDTYRVSNPDNRVSVTVAHTIEDLMRVFSIRSAVYVAEQDCPHEEEFDGNDFCATHLLGYVGHEPAGCIRIRCFADFAKVERVAVKRGFRSSRLVHRLVRAATELCRDKGYRRLYGQPRADLVRFYSHFGWRLLDGGKSLRFSDVDYVEMVLDMDRAEKPVAIGGNPYVLIRPEGRWHARGILERSAARASVQKARGDRP